MFNKIKELWKQRKNIGQVLKFVKSNRAWINVIMKAIRFAKDGYNRMEISELRTSIAYLDDYVIIKFYMKL